MPSQTLLDWLVGAYPASKKQTLKHMLEAGRVQINGRRARKLKDPVGADDKVAVLDRAALRKSLPPPAALPFGIVFEDGDILVVNKPAGLLTSTVPGERRPTLLAAVGVYLAARKRAVQVGLIHRLDRDVSGLLVFSKNDLAYQSLKTQFYHHTVGREYRAVVHGVPKPPKQRIESRLIERADGDVRPTRLAGKGQVAVTEFEVIKSEKNRSLLKVVLETGRKHQIRTQLATIGNPVVGDAIYGPDPTAHQPMLAAVRLTIKHPRTASEMTFSVPVPEEFEIRE